MHRILHTDTMEQLIGFSIIILFGIALVRWPSFTEFVDRFAFSYLRDALQILRGLVI